MKISKYKLGELVEVTRGASLSGQFYAEEGKLIRLTLGNFNMNGGGFKENTSKTDLYFTGTVRDEFILNKGDIITPLTEQSLGLLGTTARIPESGKYIQSQDVALVRCKEELLDPNFCYYLISSSIVRQQLSAAAQQTKIRHTSPEKIKDCTVWVPDFYTQKNIGRILTDIDNKIAINRRINDNLEAMAKQLYDYWFVQFDFPNEEGKPYKSSGGAMVWNEKLKREIPQGWHCGTLLDIAEYTNGLACQKYRPTDNNKLPVIKIKEMHDGLSADTEWVKADIPDDVKVFDGDVLFSWSASLEVMLWAYGNGGLNQHIFKVTSKNGYPRSFYFYQLIHYVGVFKQIAEARKTTMGHITQDHLRQSTIALPPNVDIANKLEEKLCPIFDEIVKNDQEIMALTKQRDELLPLLMNGQATVNYHLSVLFLSFLILYRDQYKFYDMKETIIQAVLDGMRAVLTDNQLELLTDVTRKALSECEITPKATVDEQRNKENAELLGAFISSKKVEGCSDKTIHYYKSSIEKLITTVKKNVCDIATNDIRCYLADQQEQRGLSKVTIDNLRRIYSSFFSWLEDEDYITKSPVRRIHKVRTDALVKEVLTDENIEVLRDSCQELRDIAMIDLLLSTGMRVGELVKINREDIDFQERQCVVFGKGNKEREVYFNARTKIHLKKYLEQRTDTNPALFVSLHEPHTRLTISGVEVRLRQLGKRVNLNKVHPHKFRRTLATMAIDKGMPIEQVQKMLGHVKIDTTLHYAMVNQTNVKIAHRKFLN